MNEIEELPLFARATADMRQGEYGWVIPTDISEGYILEEPDESDDYVFRISPVLFWFLVFMVPSLFTFLGWLLGYWQVL